MGGRTVASGWRLALGVSWPQLLGATARALWVGGRRALAARAIDAASGGEVGRINMPEPPSMDSSLICGDTLVFAGTKGLHAIDLVADRVLWSLAHGNRISLRGAAGDAIVLLQETEDSHELLVLEARTGAERRRIPLGDLGLPRLVLTDSCAFACSFDRAAAIELESGRFAWSVELGDEVTGDSLHGPVLFAQRLWCATDIELRAGPHLRLTPIRLDDGQIGRSVDLAGSLRCPAAAGDFVLLVGTRARVPVAVAWEPDGEAAVATSGEGYAAASAGFAACGCDGELSLVRRSATARLEWVRMPLPAGGPVVPSCAGGQVLIASGDHLIAIAAASVPAGQPTAALELRSLSAAPLGDGTPAVVTMAGVSGVIVVEHPELGRVRFMRHPEAPALTVGDRILLDEVDVRPGGGVDVLRWRHAGGGAGSPAAPGLERFEAADLPPVSPPRALEPLARCLVDIEEHTGRAPELLRRIAAACDRAPAARDRWDALGLRLEPPDLDDLSEQDEEGVLEGLGFSPFAEDDYHVYGFITGPAGPSGGRPLAVWRTDDLTLGWGGSDFDDWFSSWLANQRDGQSSLVSELLIDLGLAPDWADECDYAPPPSWFTAAGGASD